MRQSGEIIVCWPAAPLRDSGSAAGPIQSIGTKLRLKQSSRWAAMFSPCARRGINVFTIPDGRLPHYCLTQFRGAVGRFCLV